VGYYKNMEIELQENMENQKNVDLIVRWYRDTEETVRPYLMRLITADPEFFDKALTEFEKAEVFAPRPASSHVAMQRPRHRRRSTVAPIGWALVGVALVTGVTLLLVNL